jgi:hypothetical protein
MPDMSPPAVRGRLDDLVDAPTLDLAVQARRLAPADFRRLVFGVARSVGQMLAEYAGLEPDDAVTLARRIAPGAPCDPRVVLGTPPWASSGRLYAIVSGY